MSNKDEIKFAIRMELNFLTDLEKVEILNECLDDIRYSKCPVLKNITINYVKPAYKRGFGNVDVKLIHTKGVEGARKKPKKRTKGGKGSGEMFAQNKERLVAGSNTN